MAKPSEVGERSNPSGARDGFDSGGMLHSVRVYPEFRLLLMGTLATNTAFWMYLVAVGWLALQLTDSPLFVGLTGFAGGIPLLIFSIPVGVVIDRFDRRTILQLAQWGVMIVSALFAIMVATDTLNRVSILVLSVAYGTVMSFIFPTRTTIVPSLVERRDVANAIALNSAAQNVTRVFGPSLAGLLLATTGAAGTFGIAAIMQVVAVAATAKLPQRASGVGRGARAGVGSPGQALTVGLRAVGRDPFLVGLILMALATNVLVMPYVNLMPVFARDELAVGSTGLGLLLASVGLGTVVGALVVARSRELSDWPTSQTLSAIAFAALVIAFSAAPSMLLALPLLFGTGLVSAVFLAINQTTLLTRVADEERGRVMSIYLLTWGILPVGQLATGAMANHIGAPWAMIIACIAALAWILAVAWRFPNLRAGRS